MPMNTHTQPPPFFEASPGASYRVDELVVALAYDRVVLEQLIQWNAAPLTDDREYDEQVTGPKVDTRLALRRVPVKADQAVAHLRGEHGDWVERATDGARDAGYASSDIDVLIRCLRYAFQRRFNGWVPGIGKNRLVSRPTGSYVIQGGGAPGPVPQPDYVIQGGGATPGPVPQPDYVIQGGGGAPRPLPQPDYVIQGGGKGSAPATVRRVVQRRKAQPGAGVHIGVVDTPLGENQWLAGGYLTTADALLPPNLNGQLPPSLDHSTFVVGMILRQAPGATVVLRRGLGLDATSDSWSVARAIADLASSSPAVVNLSLGCVTDDNQAPMVLTAAVNALGPHCLVVAAAGNHGAPNETPRPTWPAAMDSVVAVGALDAQFRRAEFSPDATWVNAVAPGVDVFSTVAPLPGRGDVLFGTWSGTSFAAATVTGEIAARVGPGTSATQYWEGLQKGTSINVEGRPVFLPAPRDIS